MKRLFGIPLCALLCFIAQASIGADATVTASPSESVGFLNAQNRKNNIAVQFSEGYINVDDARLHYVSAGSGKLVVFYHGFPSYWYMWKHQLNALAKDYRVVAIDGLGANLSDKPADINAYKVSNLAHQLHQFIQSISEGEDYILVGHDWGGALSWAYAQRYPDQLQKLIVLNAPPYNLLLEFLATNPEQQQASLYIEKLKSLGRDNNLDTDAAHRMWSRIYVNHVKRGELSEAEGELFKKALAAPGALNGGINWYLANVPAPDQIREADYWPARSGTTAVDSLLIWGGDDRTFVHSMLEAMPDYAPRLQIETLPGVGHSPSLEAPETVNQLIRNFIASEDYPASSYRVPRPMKDTPLER